MAQSGGRPNAEPVLVVPGRLGELATQMRGLGLKKLTVLLSGRLVGTLYPCGVLPSERQTLKTTIKRTADSATKR